jgi:hypothetical protein
VLKRTVAEEHRLSLAPLVVNEITVIGSRCGVSAGSTLAQKISVRPLIEGLSLRDDVEAVAHAGQPGCLKCSCEIKPID